MIAAVAIDWRAARHIREPTRMLSHYTRRRIMITLYSFRRSPAVATE